MVYRDQIRGAVCKLHDGLAAVETWGARDKEKNGDAIDDLLVQFFRDINEPEIVRLLKTIPTWRA